LGLRQMPIPSSARARAAFRRAQKVVRWIASSFPEKPGAVPLPPGQARAGPEGRWRTLAVFPSVWSLRRGAGRTIDNGRRAPKRRAALSCQPLAGLRARESCFRNLCISCQTPVGIDGLIVGFDLHPARELLNEQGTTAV